MNGFYSITGEDGTVKLLAADGLGHGLEASNAVRDAIIAFKAFKSDSPAEILRYLHIALKKTRGIVGTVILVDPAKKTWKLCGIGNIATRLNGFQQAKGYLSYNGIIGHNIPHTLNDQNRRAGRLSKQVILCPDGIKSRWEQARLPDLHKQDLIVQAAALYKDFGRKTDDMSITPGKYNHELRGHAYGSLKTKRTRSQQASGSIRLGGLLNLSLSSQTAFTTAISECRFWR